MKFRFTGHLDNEGIIDIDFDFKKYSEFILILEPEPESVVDIPEVFPNYTIELLKITLENFSKNMKFSKSDFDILNLDIMQPILSFFKFTSDILNKDQKIYVVSNLEIYRYSHNLNISGIFDNIKDAKINMFTSMFDILKKNELICRNDFESFSGDYSDNKSDNEAEDKSENESEDESEDEFEDESEDESDDKSDNDSDGDWSVKTKYKNDPYGILIDIENKKIIFSGIVVFPKIGRNALYTGDESPLYETKINIYDTKDIFKININNDSKPRPFEFKEEYMDYKFVNMGCKKIPDIKKKCEEGKILVW